MHRFHPYRTKDVFKSTVELSIYIHQEYRGKGVASKLMAHILDHAKETDTLHTVVSVITAGECSEHGITRAFWIYLLWANTSGWFQTW